MTITSLQPGLPPRAETFAKRVRGLLAEAGQDQRVIAQALSVSASSASRRVRGEMEFGLGELDIVARALDTTVEYLLGFTNDRSPRRLMPNEGSEVVRHEGLEPPTRWLRVGEPRSERGGQVIPLHPRRHRADEQVEQPLPAVVIPLYPVRRCGDVAVAELPLDEAGLGAGLVTYIVDGPLAS